MAYTEEDCARETVEHINQVRNYLNKIVEGLKERGVTHDLSKLQSPEIEGFTKYTPKLKESTYGSEEYRKNLEGLQTALTHHYANNRHHPEYHVNGIKDMNLLDIVEMFCNWKAATMRHADGDLEKSIEINKQRFNYSDELEAIFKNSLKLFEEKEPTRNPNKKPTHINMERYKAKVEDENRKLLEELENNLYR